MSIKFPLAVRSVTLDLDGTLLDTVPDLAAAAAAMLDELQLPPRESEEVRDFVGRGIANLVRRCLGEQISADAAFLAQAIDVFRRHYARTNGRAAQLYPGVEAGLRRLRELGLPLAVITNKAAAFTEPLLAATGLDRHIEFAVSGDTLARMKPDPLPLTHACARLGVPLAANLHIGDSRNDAQCARAAGCPVFLVPYGYSEREDVRVLDCDAIVATLEEAANLVAAAI